MNDMSAAMAGRLDFRQITAEIVSAYVARNNLPASELPALLNSVHGALTTLGTAPKSIEEPAAELKPFVPIKKSITDEFIISLENGQKFKSLKRHLMTTYNMTPADYRAKWNLPKDYPMVAPGYAKARSALAKSLGLGRKAMPRPVPAPTPEAAPARKAGRPRRAASAEAAA